ncbi:MAG: hypothetical protein ACOX75_00165 [Lachnospiraceae bacterium]|jgi:hypothetical protein
MRKKTKNALLDIAAELIVSPLAAYVKAVELKNKFAETEAGKKTQRVVKQAGEDISAAAKTFADSETGRTIKVAARKVSDGVEEATRKVVESDAVQTVKETARKVADSETARKIKEAAKETAQKVSESDTAQKIKGAAQKVTESEIIRNLKENIEEIREFLSPDDEEVEDIINEVDLDKLVDGEEEPEPVVDDGEDTSKFEAEADKLEEEITDSLKK